MEDPWSLASGFWDLNGRHTHKISTERPRWRLKISSSPAPLLILQAERLTASIEKELVTP